MPKKNSIGAVLLTIGLILSASLYCLIWMVWPNSVSQNIELQLLDTYIVLHPLFVFVGIASVNINLYLIVLQIFKRFKINSWNFAHTLSLFLFAGFIFYGREVLRFGFVMLGRLLDTPFGSWTVYPPLSGSEGQIQQTPSRWENVANHLPETILIGLALFICLLIWRMIKINKKKAYNSTL